MTDMTSCLHVRQSLGVYVVGAIDPAERTVVDLHLAGCPDCREELAGLAGLPALLGRVPIEEAEQIAGFRPDRTLPGVPPAAGPADGDPLNPLIARMTQRRRVSRWRNLAAAAAVVLIAAGAALGAVRIAQPPGGPAVHWEHVQSTTAAGLTADIKYAAQPWGTRLQARVDGIKAGTTCEFWVLDNHGGRWEAGSWTVTSTWHGATYSESVAVPASWVNGFQVTSGSHVLLTVNAT
jgi:hypothetical protein